MKKMIFFAGLVCLLAGCAKEPVVITQVEFQKVFVPVKCPLKPPKKPPFAKNPQSFKALMEYYFVVEQRLIACTKEEDE